MGAPRAIRFSPDRPSFPTGWHIRKSPKPASNYLSRMGGSSIPGTGAAFVLWLLAHFHQTSLSSWQPGGCPLSSIAGEGRCHTRYSFAFPGTHQSAFPVLRLINWNVPGRRWEKQGILKTWQTGFYDKSIPRIARNFLLL